MGDLGQIILATRFEKLPKEQKIAQSGHTDCVCMCCYKRIIPPGSVSRLRSNCVVWADWKTFICRHHFSSFAAFAMKRQKWAEYNRKEIWKNNISLLNILHLLIIHSIKNLVVLCIFLLYTTNVHFTIFNGTFPASCLFL